MDRWQSILLAPLDQDVEVLVTDGVEEGSHADELRMDGSIPGSKRYFRID
jgi:hypothetical protein